MRTATKQARGAGGAKHARSAGKLFRYSDDKLHKLWDKLHHGDREPWPQSKGVARLAAQHATVSAWVDTNGGSAAVAGDLIEAWREFHAGDFPNAIKHGSKLGPWGSVVANKASAIYTLSGRCSATQRRALLEEAIERGAAAVKVLPGYPNAHYMLALVLGRYSQEISVVKAAASGLVSRVRTHLERALELEPTHAEAHVAAGLYHAELIGKLGRIVASLTYGASKDSALEHFRRAVKLAPASPIVRIEYANGLLLLDGTQKRDQAEELYGQAAAFEPIDAMEQLDVERAKRGPS